MSSYDSIDLPRPYEARRSSEIDYPMAQVPTVSVSRASRRPAPPRSYFWPITCLVVLGMGLLYVYCRSANPIPDDPWWAGSWQPRDGEAIPKLEVGFRTQVHRGQVYATLQGQLVKRFVDGFHVSLAITSGEAKADTLLFSIQPRQGADQGKEDRPWHVLVRRGPNDADLYQLKTPPGTPHLHQAKGGAGAVHVVPADIERHHDFVAHLVRRAD